MSAGQSLHLQYLVPCELRSQGWHDVLGAAAFAGGTPASEDPLHDGKAGVPLARIHTPPLGDASGVMEVWRTGSRAQSGSRGRVRYARAGDLIFGSLAVQEHEQQGNSRAGVDGRAADGRGHGCRQSTALELATELAYREIYASLAALGGPHLVRVWNYIPDINLETHGLERYRQFNTARHEASRACGRAVAGNVPAASALGASAESPLTVYFLASHRAPAFIENPRQVSAYRYPAQYGPRSPAFSRATMLGEGAGAVLFVSGTASIVGHRTLHAGDPAAQTRETLVNIQALLDEAASRFGGGAPRLQSLAYKVYVRDPKDLPVIRRELESALGPGASPLYLKADICRQDLSVEIEAVGGGGWRL